MLAGFVAGCGVSGGSDVEVHEPGHRSPQRGNAGAIIALTQPKPAASALEHRCSPRTHKTKSLVQLTDEFVETLAEQGYVGGTSNVVTDEDGEHHEHIDYPEVGGSPAAALYIAAIHRQSPPASDSLYIVVLETTPEEYPLLEPTFRASCSSLAVVP